MRLEPEVYEYIKNVLRVCRTVGVENVVLEKRRVRGADNESLVFLLQEEDVPEFPFTAMGLVEIPLITNRFNIFSKRMRNAGRTAGNQSAPDPKKFFVEIFVDKKGDFVRTINMRADTLKIGSKCSNPAHFQADCVIHDKLIHKIDIDRNATAFLGSIKNGSWVEPNVWIKNDKHRLLFEVETKSGEYLRYECEGNGKGFEFKYPRTPIQNVLKNNTDGCFSVGEKGMFKSVVDGFNIWVSPMK